MYQYGHFKALSSKRESLNAMSYVDDVLVGGATPTVHDLLIDYSVLSFGFLWIQGKP